MTNIVSRYSFIPKKILKLVVGWIIFFRIFIQATNLTH